MEVNPSLVTVFASLFFVLRRPTDIDWLLNRRSMISSTSSPCSRLTVLANALRRRFVICVVALRVSRSRIAQLALGNRGDLRFFRFLGACALFP
jgi:hypothetical protein